MTSTESSLRNYVIEPIPEVFESGLLLAEAGARLLCGDRTGAAAALAEADMEVLYRHYRDATGTARWEQSRPPIPVDQRTNRTLPGSAVLQRLFERDGWRCRFCDVRVIEREVRDRLRCELPDVLHWGKRNAERHAGILVHMGSHDHVLPISYGGSNDFENLVIACWTCQFARGEWLVEDIGVSDPREREPLRDDWNGLRDLLGTRSA